MDATHGTQNSAVAQKRQASESPNRPRILHSRKHNFAALEEATLKKIAQHIFDEEEHRIEHIKSSPRSKVKHKDVAHIMRTAASALVRIADVPDDSIQSTWLKLMASEGYGAEIVFLMSLPEDVYEQCIEHCYEGATTGSWENLLFNGMSQ